MKQPHTVLCAALAAVFAATGAPALAQAPALSAFTSATGDAAPPPWRVVGLPQGKVALARITMAEVDGARVARLATDNSYGTLVHDITPWTPTTSATLAWRWRLDQPLAAANLRSKDGDDAALKLCVMFDLPLDALSFGERTLMRVARTVSGEKLPAATLCYVWDVSLPTGTVLPNAYSRRVRFMVVDGTASAPGPWRSHQRSLAADFLKVFGDDTQQVPPAVAVVIGADSDSTAGRSLGYIGDLKLTP
jgi:hypothetical protein